MKTERKIESIEIRFLYTGVSLQSGGRSYIFINEIFANDWLLGEYGDTILEALEKRNLKEAIELSHEAIKSCDNLLMVTKLNKFIKFLKRFGRI